MLPIRISLEILIKKEVFWRLLMKTIEEIEIYANEYHIPIMQGEAIDYLCEFIREHKCQSILEIGSAIGYSAIRMALACPDSTIVTLERDEERYLIAKENIKDFHLEDRIELHLCDALVFITDQKFDFIFIDAAKAQYIRFFERYENNLIGGGYILSDNLDFHGYVEHPEMVTSRNLRQLVRKISTYIEYLQKKETFETKFLKLGDGIAISRKKSEK